jgi:hypothetical protein
MNLRRSSIGLHSFQGILLSRQKAQLCNPCPQNELSPISQEGHLEFGDFVMAGGDGRILRSSAGMEIGDRPE